LGEVATVELIAIRDGPKLVPATPYDLEQLESVRPGKPARVHLTHPRSAARNRWYRALIAVVAEGLGWAPGSLHSELKFKAGLVKQIYMSQAAGTVIELKSVAFAAMDETEFWTFVDMAVEIIFKDYLPGIPRNSVIDRVHDLVGPRPD
jgi:hypothetical protein